MYDIVHVKMKASSSNVNVKMGVSSNNAVIRLASTDRVIASSGTSDYDKLKNKPAINEHELRGGNNTLEEIGVTSLSNMDLINILQ